MKKTLLITAVVFVCLRAQSRQKERAADPAQNTFTKIKQEQKEKNGEVTASHTEMVSTPVVARKLSFYEGDSW